MPCHESKMPFVDSAGKRMLVPDTLFHAVVSVTNNHLDAINPTRRTYILGTYGTPDAAKSSALRALQALTFIPEFFPASQVHFNRGQHVENETTGDTAVISVPLPAGQGLNMSIQAVPNTESLATTSDGLFISAPGAKNLHYMLQTAVSFTNGQPVVEATQIKGTYMRRADAWSAAHRLLDRANYIKYSDRSDAEFWGHWPYGEEVVVHAVCAGGQTYSVSVKTAVWADAAQKRELEDLLRPAARER